MRFSLAAAALVPVLFASAEDILVQVGAGGKLVFSPQNITAKSGDTIAFQFQGKNHSVTQSTFGNPCQIQTGPQGIDSGFQFVAPNATELPQWSFTVDNDTSPLWFFCAQVTNQVNHCQMGMVFSVNAVESGPKNFAAYQALAMKGNAAAAGGAAASGGASASGAQSGANAGPTDTAGGAAGGAGGASNSASGAPTDGTNPITNGANPTDIIGAGGASPTDGANISSASGNSTAPPNAGVRVSGSTMSLVAAVGLAAFLL